MTERKLHTSTYQLLYIGEDSSLVSLVVASSFFINPEAYLKKIRQLVMCENPPDTVTGSQSHFSPARVWIK
jgi:hypothetical protein